jgi:hypothetical protein
MFIKMIVAAQGYDGPDLFFCKVNCSKEDYENGLHYEEAEKAAAKAGYEKPMVAMDENDPAGQAILDKFVWDSATIYPQNN